MPEGRELDPAADHREHGKNADRDEHRRRPLLPVMRVVMFAHERAFGFAREDEEVQAERVEAGEERAGERDDPEDDAVPVGVERGGDDRRPALSEKKPANGGTPTSARLPARNAHFVHGMSARRCPLCHLPDVLLAPERVDDESGGHEEQRLEERVRHQVEHPVRVRADACAEEHVADLRHRRVRDYALDVRLHERDQPGDEERQRPHAGGHELDRSRLLEDGVRARDEVDAGGDHRRRVNERADGRRSLHRVREPGVQRDLRRLRDRAAEQAERDEVDGRGRELRRCRERRAEVERVPVEDEARRTPRAPSPSRRRRRVRRHDRTPSSPPPPPGRPGRARSR